MRKYDIDYIHSLNVAVCQVVIIFTQMNFNLLKTVGIITVNVEVTQHYYYYSSIYLFARWIMDLDGITENHHGNNNYMRSVHVIMK